MRRFSLALVLAVFGLSFGEENTKIVETKYGKVEGCLSFSGLYYEYLGIKYGVPVKFKAPDEPPTHSDVYKADNRAVLCPQFPIHDPLSAPSDNPDCLVLNVYTPASSNDTLPVMVFIHGGGFGVGSGSPTFYGPQYLLTHDIVLVTVNYRLNAYGFLNLHTKEAPGNAGLKDIRAALRWVRDNIEMFGGDPDNVTIFGHGTGGVAAILMTMSESTAGLFHRVISESGSLFSPQAFDPDPIATASQIAKSLEVNTDDPNKLYEVFSETSILKLEEAIMKQMNCRSVFVPSAETIFEDEEPFLTDTPYNILTQNKTRLVPILIGLNTVEGLTSTLDYFTITSQIDRLMNDDVSVLDQRNFIVPKDDKDDYRNMIRDTYFANITEEALVGGLINFNSDFSFVGPMSMFVDLYANVSGQPVYQYIFNHVGTRNLGRLLTNSSLPATSHYDELFYLFELERLPLPMDEDDARIITFMTMLWTNFAKYETPTIDPGSGEWLPYPHNLAIAIEPQYVTALTPERASFWRDLYQKYGAEIKN